MTQTIKWWLATTTIIIFIICQGAVIYIILDWPDSKPIQVNYYHGKVFRRCYNNEIITDKNIRICEEKIENPAFGQICYLIELDNEASGGILPCKNLRMHLYPVKSVLYPKHLWTTTVVLT